jgi:predicted RNase H-like HicB family nuclease
MRKLTAVICGGKDQYGTWIEELPGVYGAGNTVEETQASLQEGLRLLLEDNDHVPDVLKSPYQLEFVFDTSGFLKFYSGFISFAGMKAITGINQKQLWNYANGYRKPNKDTALKILNSLNDFGKEIAQAQFRF